MKTFVLILILSAFLYGCETSPNARYELIEIEGEAYFLDQNTGAIYSIDKHEDGKFDINRPVGRVGYVRDAF